MLALAYLIERAIEGGSCASMPTRAAGAGDDGADHAGRKPAAASVDVQDQVLPGEVEVTERRVRRPTS